MRIAFSGAAGTGKSFLAKIVSERLGIPECPVGSRTVCKEMGFEHAYDVDQAGKRAEFQRRLCERKRAWEEETPSFVSDRTHLDNLAYTILHAVDAVDQEFLDMILAANATYTHIILIDARAKDAFMNLDDPARKQNPVYQRHYAMLVGGLWAYYIATKQWILYLTTPDFELRKEHVFNFLGRNS